MSDIPESADRDVSEIAVAWEITKITMRTYEPQGKDAEEIADNVGQVFLKALAKVREGRTFPMA